MASARPTELIPADVRARLKGLRLSARFAPGGGGLGQHVSRNRGAGLEFAQYRAYEPGDEPRRIDWKLFSRSDRYFVRESERDAALDVWVLIDASASMGLADGRSRRPSALAPSMEIADRARPDWRKLDAAVALAACVAELAVRQSDRFGFAALSSRGTPLVPAAAGARARDRAMLALAKIDPGGEAPTEATLRQLWSRIPPAALVLIVSDFFDPTFAALAQRLAATRREVLTIQVVSAEERDFPFRGGHRFRDPETGIELQADAPSARAQYLENFARARRQLGATLAASGIRHVEYALDEPLDRPLRRFFAARGAEAASA